MSEKKKSDRAAEWRETLISIAQDKGFFEDVGPEHKALYLPHDGAGGQTLVVVFDNLDDARQQTNRLPWAVDFIHSQGWSVLGLMAHGPTWYREKSVLDFFDRLRDEAFYKQFKRVVFYGTSMGGYAASAFSASCPGASVVAINPQATLARDRTSWETRFRPAWKRDFTSRYGYAPDMVKTAKKVWIFYDSRIAPDAGHAVLFQGDNIEKIRCPFMGHGVLSIWRDMGVLKDIVLSCIAETATTQTIRNLLRERHKSPRYQKLVLNYLIKHQRHDLIVRWTDAVLAREAGGPHYRQARTEALDTLKRKGLAHAG